MGISPSVIINNCVGLNPNIQGQKLYSYWKTDDTCYNAFYEELYFSSNLPGATIQYQYGSVFPLQFSVNILFNNYISTNKFTTPGGEGYDQFQEVLFDFCRSFPGLCNLSLENLICNNITGTPDEIRNKIASDSTLTKLCGCFSPNPSNLALVTAKECDPLCTRIGTIPLNNVITGEALTCKSDICIINDVSVQATQSQVGGGVQISQVCSNCNGNCKCILAGIDINTLGSSIGLKGQFNAYCDPRSQCFITDPKNPTITTATSCSILQNDTISVKKPSSLPSWWVTGWILVCFVIIIIFVIIIKYNSRPKVKKLVSKYEPLPIKKQPNKPSFVNASSSKMIIRSDIPKPTF